MNLSQYKFSFIIFLLLVSCSSFNGEIGPTNLPSCTIENVMVDKSLIPEEMLWAYTDPSIRTAPIRWGVDRRGITFTSQKNGGAIQAVHRGRDVNHTEEGYFNLLPSWFDEREGETDWYIPPEFAYKGTIADRYRFGCRTHKPSGVQSCQIVAQYGIYLSRFEVDMSPIMTYDDLERILRAIDDKMAQCLSK